MKKKKTKKKKNRFTLAQGDMLLKNPLQLFPCLVLISLDLLPPESHSRARGIYSLWTCRDVPCLEEPKC
eukprot:11109156-Prorocentrum_lima.AAC.1